MASSLQVLGIPPDIVELKRSTGALDELLALAETNFRNFARYLHPDKDPSPGAAGIYLNLSHAIEDLRDPDGMELAIESLVGEDDRQSLIRRVEQEIERNRIRKNLRAVLGLLPNIDQFGVLDIPGPTSFLLQFGASRTILDVNVHDRAVLHLTFQELDVLPEQTEKARFAEGRWQEMYLSNETELWLSHRPEKATPVNVIGFVPARSLRYRTDDTFNLVTDEYSELGGTLAGMRMTPVWSKPSEAWFLQFVEDKPHKDSEVVVMDGRGNLALIGTIQASEAF